MFKQLWVPTYVFLAGLMADMLGYDPSSGMRGILNTCYTALFQTGSPAPSNNSTIASQTEATYTGYARQAISWFPTNVDAAGPQSVTGANQQFRATDAVSPNSITQIGIVTALTGGSLLLLAALANPINMAVGGAAFTYAPVVQLSNLVYYGGPLAFA